MKVWTDYPFRANDRPLSFAPIRKVRVLNWDGDKYVTIRWRDEIHEVKFGYLYPERGRYGDHHHVNPRLYPLMDMETPL